MSCTLCVPGVSSAATAFSRSNAARDLGFVHVCALVRIAACNLVLPSVRRLSCLAAYRILPP